MGFSVFWVVVVDFRDFPMSVIKYMVYLEILVVRSEILKRTIRVTRVSIFFNNYVQTVCPMRTQDVKSMIIYKVKWSMYNIVY